MIDIFDMLGPIMVGPSSSHTAGAVRIGHMARTLLGERPVEAELLLHGSFATTGIGHGTDRALIAGLLGMQPDDLRIPNSFELAAQEGLRFTFGTVELPEAHPNTVVIRTKGETGKTLEMQACSTGGGRIMVTRLNGIDVSFTGDYNTLVIHNQDAAGPISQVTTLLSRQKINIANMNLCREARGGSAIMVIETDQAVPPVTLLFLEELEGITQVTYYEKEDE